MFGGRYTISEGLQEGAHIQPTICAKGTCLIDLIFRFLCFQEGAILHVHYYTFSAENFRIDSLHEGAHHYHLFWHNFRLKISAYVACSRAPIYIYFLCPIDTFSGCNFQNWLLVVGRPTSSLSWEISTHSAADFFQIWLPTAGRPLMAIFGVFL